MYTQSKLEGTGYSSIKFDKATKLEGTEYSSLKFDKATLYLKIYKDCDYNYIFGIDAFQLPESDYIFVKLGTDSLLTKEGKKQIILEKFLFNKLQQEANRQLHNFLKDNINSYDSYRDIVETSPYILFYAIQNREEKIYLNYRFSEISLSGIATMHVNTNRCNKKIVYNLITNEILEGKNELLEIFYPYKKYRFLMSEQEKIGKLPLFFKELIKLNIFLKEKKSVKVILNNNFEYVYKNPHTISLPAFFDIDKKRGLYIRKYQFSIVPPEDIFFNEIKYFRYGRKIYEPNPNTNQSLFSILNEK